jgi:hypothetical protein
MNKSLIQIYIVINIKVKIQLILLQNRYLITL